MEAIGIRMWVWKEGREVRWVDKEQGMGLDGGDTERYTRKDRQRERGINYRETGYGRNETDCHVTPSLKLSEVYKHDKMIHK